MGMFKDGKREGEGVLSIKGYVVLNGYKHGPSRY